MLTLTSHLTAVRSCCFGAQFEQKARLHTTRLLYSYSNRKSPSKYSHFVDFVRFRAKGGDGGDGCVSFMREKYLPKGPPNGGNGGRGGNVIIRATTNEGSLRRLGRVCSAKRGHNGMGGGRHGMRGDDLVIQVPVGTIVREVPLPEKKEEEEPMDKEARRAARWVYYPRMDEVEAVPEGKVNFFKQAERLMDEEDRYLRWRLRNENPTKIEVDLAEDGQEVLVCKGGAGGYGNPYFLTTENRSPKWATRGRKGEERQIELELKTIADIGLVGLPNAGKSTLLGAISNAHPKQGNYAFTTLHPFVGTVDYADQFQLTVADIPGLIEGAHLNVGLGHAFLRHVERAKLLVYVIDISGPSPFDDLKILQQELEAYKPGLIQRQSLIVANKADIVNPAKENLEILQSQVKNIPIVPVSARYEKNVLKLTSVLRKEVERIRAEEEAIKKTLRNDDEEDFI
ncbi:obg family GTPase CgtA [Rhizopus microsporus var. microsporus]|uniref:GTP-binding protein Obg/CgtA n=2 Tax=Rhizopus microsporus TaxID=58291 RepID=A0A2G4SU35_RHIZD|nr:GTP-binding protein Obg/CgtA [Rhizopus microsporus ATCC 52813]ORE11389.1 obg family GTPase CgtA [Rhizopus microsporus var. microsporus]PHZ12271.1 GTP-binding protein Obg/CgtA [Rhizopus microsporus ATCC 52813]